MGTVHSSRPGSRAALALQSTGSTKGSDLPVWVGGKNRSQSEGCRAAHSRVCLRMPPLPLRTLSTKTMHMLSHSLFRQCIRCGSWQDLGRLRRATDRA